MNAIQQSIYAGVFIVGCAVVWLKWDQIKAFVAPVVNRYWEIRNVPASNILSTYASDEENDAVCHAQTDRQTDNTEPTDKDEQPQVAITEERKEALILHFMRLRAAGAKREEVRSELLALGIKLDNNLWAEADKRLKVLKEAEEKDAEPPQVTPIVGRPTSARFFTYDNPDLNYKEPEIA